MNARSRTPRLAFRTLVGALSLAAAVPAARASDVTQDRNPAGCPALVPMNALDVMHLIDADQKGFVTREEFLKFRQAFFDRMDRDRDGRLSASEFADEELAARAHTGP